jgi:hypothetical protein
MNKVAWLITGVLLVVGVTLPMLIPKTSAGISLGDWGDYIGGLAGTLALIWLIVGHFQNQAGIRETKEDLKTQLELTQDVAAALSRVAAGTQVQAARVLADSEPQFVSMGSMAEDMHGYEFKAKSTASAGFMAIRNDGEPVTLVGVASASDGLKVRLERTGPCLKGQTFRINIESNRPLSSTKQIKFLIHFDDKFKRRGAATFQAAAFDAPPHITIHYGSPE